jgi:glutamate synthase domain-containing protein 2
MGIATQDPVLESRLDGDAGAARVANFLKALAGEIRTFVRVTGHDSVTEFSAEDLCTTDASIAEASGIRHA